MENKKITITQREKEMFDYLNILRETGITNMFGAAPFLKKEFHIDLVEARKVLTKWMHNFNEDGYEDLLEE